MEFGPEIKVDGVRPEWLSGGEPLIVSWSAEVGGAKSWPGSWTPDLLDKNPLGLGGWLNVEAIQLPIRHACYSYKQREAHISSSITPSRTPLEDRMVAPELVARMVEHLKDCGQAHNIRPRDPDAQRRYDEMKAILVALEPVDEDLVEARKIALKFACPAQYSSPGTSWRTMEGDYDNSDYMQAIHAALARGRQLEKESNHD
jgi:hypothetical protein